MRQDIPQDLTLTKRDGLPDALRVLLDELPRAQWPEHPNFEGMVKFWLDRHLMFRQLLGVLQQDARALTDRQIDFSAFGPRLARYGGMLLNELHGHHQIEDVHYFPHLARLDPRLEQGFALLDNDHGAMDGLLHEMADGANAVLQAQGAADQLGAFHDRLNGFEAMLDRHLADEEELIVPVILKTGFGG